MWEAGSELHELIDPFLLLLPTSRERFWKWLDHQHRSLSADVHDGWGQVMGVRDEVLKALETAKAAGIENSLDAGVVLPDPDGALAAFESDLADLFEVSRVRIDPAASAIAIEDLREQPACERSWRRDETVAERANGCLLSDRDWDAVQTAG